jgi:hypothetical protein
VCACVCVCGGGDGGVGGWALAESDSLCAENVCCPMLIKVRV